MGIPGRIIISPGELLGTRNEHTVWESAICLMLLNIEEFETVSKKLLEMPPG